ncbi:MAG: hypothetical protein CUN55_19040, partial [Phototrophicales bacterium]
FYIDAGNSSDIVNFAKMLESKGDALSLVGPFLTVRSLTHAGTIIDEDMGEPIVIVSRQANYRTPCGNLGGVTQHYGLSLSFLEALAQRKGIAQQQRLIQMTSDVKRAFERGVLRHSKRDAIALPQDSKTYTERRMAVA